MRISLCVTMNSRAPGSFLSLSRRRLITSSEDTLRSASGLSDMNMLAALRWPPPVKPVTYSTAGSSCTMDRKRLSRCSMAW